MVSNIFLHYMGQMLRHLAMNCSILGSVDMQILKLTLSYHCIDWPSCPLNFLYNKYQDFLEVKSPGLKAYVESM